MKSIEFLEGKLHELYSKFEDVQIRYEYRSNTQSHLVEVLPSSFFETNKTYMKDEAFLEDEFETLYPMENIIFISEGSLTEIKKADLELGCNKIIFDNGNFNIDFEIAGYSGELETAGYNNYALAA